MTTITQNITQTSHHVHAGENRTIRFDVVDSAGTPQTMTGWTLQWELYASKGTTITTKTTSDGISIGDGDGTDDRASVDFDVGSLVPGTYYHELARTDTGDKIVLAEGYVQIEASRL